MSTKQLSVRLASCALGVSFALATLAAAAQTQANAAQASVMVSSVTFSGNKAYTSDQLSAIIANDIGHPLTLEGMRGLAAKIEAHYHAQGYTLVKVVVPQQEFGNNRALQLTVLEGWLGNITVQNNPRFPSYRVERALAAEGVVQGQPFSLEQIERALTRLNRLSGITVTSRLQPGTQAGSTDLFVDVTEAKRITGMVEVNNYGSENTGQWRLIPRVNFEDLTGRGDELGFVGMKSLGAGDLKYGSLMYSLPVNALGTKVMGYYSKGNVNVGKEYQVLDIKGDNSGWGLGVSHDFVRSARRIYTAEAWFESSDLEQKMLSTTTSKDEIRKLRFGLTFDDTGLSGRTLAQIQMHYGLGDALGGMDDNSPLSSRAYSGGDNKFTKFTFDVARIERIASRWTLTPRLSGQYSTAPLVSAEQWTIGGVSSVAGYMPSYYAGDSGYTASLEARFQVLPDNSRYQAFARVDHGRIFIRTPFINQDSNAHLTGATLGVQALPIDALELRLEVTTPIGDQDGKGEAVYAQARYRF
ncbi:hemolysin activation/secretion protein [Bordetella ansorpii]|uniref:Hemolysin activation/secretion protein n=1 Tax=Bordetella ansorpii TaxID=288768 RepID=A0A157S4K9_9BORD|nr:ShlB/FhaC/HecB family hemolysin secretion/activation protein [Bordetella ansorpii]SAI65319.1 hemolysin activation/secretion protein [Bordetella ansorpii]